MAGKRLNKALGCFLDSQQNRVVPKERVQGFPRCNQVRPDVCDRHLMDSSDDILMANECIL
jgi:hypothetical protein